MRRLYENTALFVHIAFTAVAVAIAVASAAEFATEGAGAGPLTAAAIRAPEATIIG